MSVFISLLRGINVGGNKRIKMAELRELYASLGFVGTQTLLQSGNAVFSTEMTDSTEIVTHIEKGIQDRFGFESRIIIRTADELNSILEEHPYTQAQLDEPKKILITFLTDVPEKSAIDQLLADHQGDEQIKVIGREVYLFYPNGMGRSKLDNNFMERRLKCTGTGRNWNTSNRLLDLVNNFEI